MNAPQSSDAWIRHARSIRIEDELARRGFRLRGQNERCGPCPVCGGDDRFSINVAKQVFNCRGCNTGGDVIDLVKHLDGVDFITACTTLTGETPPHAKPNGSGHAGTARPEVKAPHANWIYKNEDGTPYLRVKRIDLPDGKKSYPQYRWNGAGWETGKPAGPKIPYRLPELVNAPGQPVFICEGEKCADAVAALGCLATTASEGAGKWTPDLNKWFADRTVYIVPDNDAAGAHHANIVASSLHGVASEVRVIKLEGLDEGEDVFDWIAREPFPENLLRIAEDAPLWEELEQQKPNAHHEDRQQKPQDGIAVLVGAKASSYKMTIIKWLWPDRFAIGKLGIIAGLPDEGKGQTLAYIAAQVTNGGEWPMSEGRSPQGSVVIFSDEDDPNDTLVPRFAAGGADLERIHIIKMVQDNKNSRMFSLVSDLDALRRKIIEIDDVRLVLIDPISAYLGVGKVDSFRGTDVRAVLTPLTTLAIETKVAVIGVMHFNKKTDVTNALLRISDSLAFGAVARHVYGVIDDAENERKLFVRAKNNVAAKMKNKTLGYRFGAREVAKDDETGEPIIAPHILWDPEYVDVTAVEAMQAASEAKSPAAKDEAMKFLSETLAKGPVLKTEIQEAAEANGVSERTLFRAKRDLKVVARKDRTRSDGKWTWELPPEQAAPRPYWSEK